MAPGGTEYPGRPISRKLLIRVSTRMLTELTGARGGEKNGHSKHCRRRIKPDN